MDGDDPGSGYRLDEDLDAGIGARYAISSSWAAEATFNPDFSQVESDAVQIDVNTNFALFYPEKRPFFQEGSDLWNTYFTPIYTRQINDPSVAGKVLGERVDGDRFDRAGQDDIDLGQSVVDLDLAGI